MNKFPSIPKRSKSNRVIAIAGASSLVVAIVVSLQGCVAIPAASLGGNPSGRFPLSGVSAARPPGAGPNIFDANQATGPTDATTFAYAVKSFSIGETTMAQAEQKLGKTIMANKTAAGTTWIYTLADKTKAPDMVIGAAGTTRIAEIYNPGGSGFLQFDSNGILRGVEVSKMSVEGGVFTRETVYSKGRIGPGAN
jgi:hypothetical protein